MNFDRRHFVTAGAGVAIQGCAIIDGDAAARRHSFAKAQSLSPLLLSEDRLMRITVCTRPFRPAGPRLETEKIAGKLVVHNYGHGGSGWSLSWGCAAEAAALALEGGMRKVVVIGAGVIGLTTAVRLVEAGAEVTLYAKEFPSESRSARATGVWSPSSRIALDDEVDEGFAERWEKWARESYAVHQHYVGTTGRPVEFIQQYALFNEPGPSESVAPGLDAARDFLHLGRRLRGMTPGWSTIAPGAHPFRAERVRSGLVMTFNAAAYAERLTRDFLLRGGQMVRRDFPNHTSVLELPEPVIVNCTGYGAKTLWDDDSLSPVRGQINWLAPQLNARYGVFYRNVTALSRSDGVIIQYTGPNEDFGYGNDSEIEDRDEMVRALNTLRPVFT